MDNNSVPPANGTVRLESAFSLFKPSMDAVAINLGSMIGLLLLPLVPFVVLVVLFFVAHGNSTANIVLFALAGLLLIGFYAYAVLSGVALIILSLAGARGQQMGLKASLKAALPYFWRYLGFAIFLGIISFVALLIFIVPFFFVLKRYYLTAYYLVDRNLSIGEAMRQSVADSKRYSGGIWGLIGVQLLITLPCIIPFLGSLAAFVLSVMYYEAPAIRYLEIKGERMVAVGYPTTSASPMPPAANPGAPYQAPMPPTPPTAIPPQQPPVNPMPPSQPPANPPRPLIQ